jgi:hypothetical protein
MAVKPCSQPLKSNPFITYRDPITGKWIVVSQDLLQAIISDFVGAGFTNDNCLKQTIS